MIDLDELERAIKNGDRVLKDELLELIRRLREAERDADRLAFVYSTRKTGSTSMIKLELRLLNNEKITLDEARYAIDAAIEKEGMKNLMQFTKGIELP